jgi:hypothetical protein
VDHTGEQIELWRWAQEWKPGDPALIIDNEEFDQCTFVGPGVLMFIGGVKFYGNDLDADALWVVDRERGYQGAIAIRNTTFSNCAFVNVGLATDEAFVQQIFDTQAESQPQ